MNRKLSASPETMVETIDEFIDQVLDYMKTDEQRFHLLTSGDIMVEFEGKQVSIPTNADTIDALHTFMKRIVDDKNYEGGFGNE